MKTKSYLALVVLVAAALVYSQRAESYPSKPGPDQELIAEGCVAIVVVGVGVVIVTSIKKLCDKINPPKKPSGHHPMPMPIPASAGVPYQGSQNTPFQFDDTAVQCWDISDYSTNAAFHGPDGIPYHLYFSYQFRTSNDLRTWETNQVVGYVSPTWTHTSVGTNAVLIPRPYRPQFALPTNGASIFYQPINDA
jgi:hypothetical protein